MCAWAVHSQVVEVLCILACVDMYVDTCVQVKVLMRLLQACWTCLAMQLLSRSEHWWRRGEQLAAQPCYCCTMAPLLLGSVRAHNFTVGMLGCGRCNSSMNLCRV